MDASTLPLRDEILALATVLAFSSSHAILLESLSRTGADHFFTFSVSVPSRSQSSNMGKVHGSLARAGKVKGQTPKVEKQEKPKQPKGRAKKRLLYNRCVWHTL